MPIIGITGGIATGKTAFCQALRPFFPNGIFFDADRAARELADNNPEVQAEIVAAFGPEIYTGRHLNRDRLRTIVFADPEKKLVLEQILHPRIRRQWAAQAERRHGSTEPFFADIPLLYETGGEIHCERVVVVACSPHFQRERLMKRSSLSAAAAEEMIAAQMPLAEKIARATHVVWNNGTTETLRAQTELLARLWQGQ
jgi:dephospho-CoA kinase